ncbi:hypothetical protein AGABI1DRAFT_132077 [Agaricus bisporus var. burnettii JB137-S8]|uniref:Uncharacterized protein n=1 Tax=Agaricus bisporus var. burnettii (strain JB137-S8 / ATCC MYA-4627 / FGSC 10392) TaxID=597362 RepID=K5XMA3_AGABU|nr:uncharacterized protein AGABI1DRAFT_132077 [Agaricus bisporus var. burnettii JB137-S8]EKM75685.1 hypothetical protein AGABI1DRAFT_132077 [Agaricus bisporus var. burnettii JB137-S8]
MSPVDPSLPRLHFKDLCSDYTLITWDEEGRVVAVLTGWPNKQDFVDTCTYLYIAMKTLSAKIHFQDGDVNYCRGNYPAISVGITPGQGSKHPTFQMPNEYKNLMEALLANTDFHDAADYYLYKFFLLIG